MNKVYPREKYEEYYKTVEDLIDSHDKISDKGYHDLYKRLVILYRRPLYDFENIIITNIYYDRVMAKGLPK